MRASRAIVRGFLLAGLCVGCLAAPRAAPAAGAPRVCKELADVFYVIARYEQRGDSKESQLVWLRREFAPDEEASPLGIFDRALDYVYATDADPGEIRASVLDKCVTDERGQAVLRLPGL